MTSATAVVVPGGQFGPAAPLLMYAADAAEHRGADLHRVRQDEVVRLPGPAAGG